MRPARRLRSTRAWTHAPDFKVADLSLAEFGRKEIQPRRARDARPHGAARRVRRRASRCRRPHHRLAAHDRSRPRCSSRRWSPSAPRSAGRRCNIFSTQDHAAAAVAVGPDGTADEPAGRPGLRLEGRDARGVLVVHRAGAALARRRRPEHDPRRRRRRHAARPQGRRVRDGRRGARPPSRRLRGVRGRPRRCCARTLAEDAEALDPDRRRHQGRHRGDHHRRAPPLRDGAGRHAAVPGHQRQRLGDQVASSTTSTAAATR